MKKELQDELYKKYPKLYRQNTLSMQETCMCWGICVGDGWYDIIDRLSAKLEAYGFVQAAQVKEKFGGLRFYIDGVDSDSYDEVHAHIHQAELEASKTCERCGQPGETKGGGWASTLCDDCRDSK